MDHGPGVKINEEPVTVLGKRGVYSEVQETEDSVEKQSTKRSKSQSDSQCHATAGVLDHPCQDQGWLDVFKGLRRKLIILFEMKNYY